ncbi:J domain-containing protein [Luteimonas terricola]|uniref:J domain-containing protein n=1 Tax=Luteimonas terricola TaxID=645597 RepID=A0ABQ2EH40_9GAMM|nr:J domain-containing protein [Luteimonas terricola]GGK09042.1 hypothetical protein GCM10011394_18120 [Luteimonas terricola]
MTHQTDFFVLYRELGIEPECSMDGLRLAYRRRVADLHPDRGGDSGGDTLKSLNQRYAAALDFHRHYGRLPGAPPAPSVRRRHDPAEPARRMEDAVEPELEQEARRPSKVVVYGIVLVAALLVWWLSRTEAPLPGFLESVIGNKRETAPPAAIALRRGMPARDVLALLGDPVSREFGDTHWEYGPSWVRFECAEVIDWYSSPLRPLKASRSRPSGTAATSAGARRCPPVAAASTRRW